MADRLDLVEKTLLWKDVHKEHSQRLGDRYVNKWDKFKKSKLEGWSKLPTEYKKLVKKPSDKELASKHLRFITLVDSVTTIDHISALDQAKRMKEQFLEKLNSNKEMWCLGSIECEVISLRLMNQITKIGKTSESEKRKLAVCEKLSEDIKNTIYKDERSNFLVHFHGILLSKKEEAFDVFAKNLKSNNQWNRAPRQIEIKKLSESFAGKEKTTKRNLRDIANYITKGGNDWCANKAYLRYKVSFELDDGNVVDEMTWVLKNWRRNDQLREEHSEGGIEDILSMTPEEVVELVMLIDKLMSLNRSRTGYLISTGS